MWLINCKLIHIYDSSKANTFLHFSYKRFFKIISCPKTRIILSVSNRNYSRSLDLDYSKSHLTSPLNGVRLTLNFQVPKVPLLISIFHVIFWSAARKHVIPCRCASGRDVFSPLTQKNFIRPLQCPGSHVNYLPCRSPVPLDTSRRYTISS